MFLLFVKVRSLSSIQNLGSIKYSFIEPRSFSKLFRRISYLQPSPKSSHLAIPVLTMHFLISTIPLLTIYATMGFAQPVIHEKRMDCGPSSQYYQPGDHCQNLLYTSGGGEGGHGCGPTSQYYKPGPDCENTLFSGGISNSTVSNSTATADCGPSSQYYKPGVNCENTLYTSGGGEGGYGCGPATQYYKPGANCENTLFPSGGSGDSPTYTSASSSTSTGGASSSCGPSSQWYKPGPNCENTLYTS